MDEDHTELSNTGRQDMVRVVISVGGKFHAYNTVRAAQRAGMLERFFTTVYDESESSIDRSRVTEFRIPDLVGRALRRLPRINGLVQWNWAKDNSFDLMARARLPECEIFHVWNGYGLYSMRRAKAQGATVVVDRGAAHPATQQRMLQEEYTRWAAVLPAMNDRLVSKQMQELMEADYIFIPSGFVRRSMLSEGVAESSLVEIPYGVDVARFRPGPRRDHVFRVIFVGQVSLQKGIPYLLEAMRSLNLANAELMLVGALSPNTVPILDRYRNVFRAVGPVHQRELPALYSNSSVLVLPSIQDGSPMVVPEAMACGLPVIISENVGASVRPGVNGFVVPIRDVEALAEKILFLYENEHDRQAMGAAALVHVQGLTWEQYGEQVVGAYRRGLSREE